MPPPDHDPEARTGSLPPSERPITRLTWRQVAVLVAAVAAVATLGSWLVATGRGAGAAEASMLASVLSNTTEITRNTSSIEKLECLPERMARVEVQLEQQARSLERIEMAVGSSRRKD